MKNAIDFHTKKLTGLRAILNHLVALDRVYSELVELEDSVPGGDSYAEYANLNVLLSDVRGELQCILEPTEEVAELVAARARMIAG